MLVVVVVDDARREARGKGMFAARGCVRWARLLRNARPCWRMVFGVARLVWLFVKYAMSSAVVMVRRIERMRFMDRNGNGYTYTSESVEDARRRRSRSASIT
jgi:hypothetical protein